MTSCTLLYCDIIPFQNMQVIQIYMMKLLTSFFATLRPLSGTKILSNFPLIEKVLSFDLMDNL